MIKNRSDEATGGDDKKSSSKNKKKGAEKKAKGGVDAKTVSEQRVEIVRRIEMTGRLVESDERIPTYAGRSEIESDER